MASEKNIQRQFGWVRSLARRRRRPRQSNANFWLSFCLASLLLAVGPSLCDTQRGLNSSLAPTGKFTARTKEARTPTNAQHSRNSLCIGLIRLCYARRGRQTRPAAIQFVPFDVCVSVCLFAPSVPELSGHRQAESIFDSLAGGPKPSLCQRWPARRQSVRKGLAHPTLGWLRASRLFARLSSLSRPPHCPSVCPPVWPADEAQPVGPPDTAGSLPPATDGPRQAPPGQPVSQQQ